MEIDKNIPGHFICPISFEVFTDPVLCSVDGQTYERSAIEDWIKIKKLSPFTKQPIQLNNLTPNRILLDIVNEWKTKSSCLSDKIDKISNSEKIRKNHLDEILNIQKTIDGIKFNCLIEDDDKDIIYIRLKQWINTYYIQNMKIQDGKKSFVTHDGSTTFTNKLYTNQNRLTLYCIAKNITPLNFVEFAKLSKFIKQDIKFQELIIKNLEYKYINNSTSNQYRLTYGSNMCMWFNMDHPYIQHWLDILQNLKVFILERAYKNHKITESSYLKKFNELGLSSNELLDIYLSKYDKKEKLIIDTVIMEYSSLIVSLPTYDLILYTNMKIFDDECFIVYPEILSRLDELQLKIEEHRQQILLLTLKEDLFKNLLN
jgi:hypothetical protein